MIFRGGRGVGTLQQLPPWGSGARRHGMRYEEAGPGLVALRCFSLVFSSGVRLRCRLLKARAVVVLILNHVVVVVVVGVVVVVLTDFGFRTFDACGTCSNGSCRSGSAGNLGSAKSGAL